MYNIYDIIKIFYDNFYIFAAKKLFTNFSFANIKHLLTKKHGKNEKFNETSSFTGSFYITYDSVGRGQNSEPAGKLL
ncbi:MAG: hypothetical protein STSR0006_06870 [Lentimicrobium sp.]